MKEEDIFREEQKSTQIEDISSNIQIESGTPLCVAGYYDWLYIPINPKLSESVIKKFKSGLKKNGIEEEKVLNLDTDYFKENIAVLLWYRVFLDTELGVERLPMR